MDKKPQPHDVALDAIAPEHRVTTEAELESLYGAAMPTALAKEIDHISPHYRAFVEKAPFVAVATAGPEGLDCSPRGDPGAVVRIADDKTVLMPDRRGNNRLDSLRNIVRDPRIALLFLIPGIGEALRINGTAEIVTDPALCRSFTIEGKVPASVIVVHVERAYFQCSKALIRSRLWEAEAQVPRAALPSTGEMLAAVSQGEIDAQTFDAAYPQRLKDTMY